ncbi:MAG TPA: hypothetical protein VKQ08_12110 [Cyclobacteriaceae bacterium]|nr:hypothetical protein [Cyclobacteriaceae bacterium]
MSNELQAWWHELNKNRSNSPEIISFIAIRRTLGFLGISLPAVLYVGSLLFAQGCILQPSISHYYYTNMREVFVGVLCAFSLFLFTYKGYSRLDSWAANLAGFFCLGVAIFPTNFLSGYPCQVDVVAPITIKSHSTIHFICATIFFLTLAAISYFLFTRTNPDEIPKLPKRIRNGIYKVCAVIMTLSLATIGAGFFIFHMSDTNTLVFCCETAALLSFGISWLTKGEMLFPDPPVKKIISTNS